MKGYIKIEVTTHEGREGLSVQTHLEHVTYMDRLQILHSLCHSLNIESKELKFMAELMGSGILDETTDVTVLEDDTVPSDDKRQSKCDCKKSESKSKVHVIGADERSTLMHDLLKMLLD